ncbi:MAG: acyl-ACP--UDP-N-acetylglucosamine O-acyltransferase [Betaproteobacteria bacterium]|nr:acyl-ACP--UDP-N-acetylglucosamine O-acyltransferase [Betaproteobacteria bacterium]
MARIHVSAQVDPRAELAADVEVGAFSIVGPDVVIGPGTRVGPHAIITGHTRIGARNRIFQFASIGDEPQDKKYRGETTRLEIGDDNLIREFCTLNVGTVQDQGLTRIGHRNWIMAYVHIAHDCVVGNDTIFANNTQLAGHVSVGDFAVLGGFTGVHQFCRVGAHVITAIASVVVQDIPPFVTAAGNPARPHGTNSEGLKRRGYTAEDLATVKRAYKTLYRRGLTLDEARAQLLAEAAGLPVLEPLLTFLGAPGRGIARPRAG